MAWFNDRIKPKSAPVPAPAAEAKVPAGFFVKCDGCGSHLLKRDVEAGLHVCGKCAHHFAMPARARLWSLFDGGVSTEHAANLQPQDPLKFKDSKKYADRLKAAQKQSGENDAYIWGEGLCGGMRTTVGAFAYDFMGGSMGSVAGEKIARQFEWSARNGAACVVVSTSGGARMQEGILSLMQMAKTVAALQELREARLPYISVLTNPTTGGVAASFALLGDVILAEPKALIGFAGPRVIEQTVRQKLPEGFQRSEFLLEHGFVDRIVPRPQLRAEIIQFLRLLLPAALAGGGPQPVWRSA